LTKIVEFSVRIISGLPGFISSEGATVLPPPVSYGYGSLEVNIVLF